MKRLNSFILAAVIAAFCIFVSGCGNSQVNIVRNGTMGSFKNLTIGEAMENYKYFKDTRWRFLKTANGRRIVEFRASYGLYKGIYKNTDYQQFYLVMQFTLNVDNSFELTYLGAEDIYKNGKIKKRNIPYNHIRECIQEIYKNGDTTYLIAPRVLSCKILKWEGKYIGKIFDDYKRLKSAKWVINSYNKAEFIGVPKADRDSKAAGIEKELIRFKNGEIKIERVSPDDDRAMLIVDAYNKKYDEIMGQIEANKKISYIFDPVRLFKNTADYKKMMQYKYLSDKKISMGKNAKTIIFSGVLKQTEILKQAGIVEKKVLIEYEMLFNTKFRASSCFFENKYKDGSKKRFKIPFPRLKLFAVLYGKNAELDFYDLLLSNKDISLYLNPLRIFILNKRQTIFEELLSKGFKIKPLLVKSGRAFFQYSCSCNHKSLAEIIAIVSVDVNGQNAKFEKTTMKLHNGKIIKCATDYTQETKLPNPIYYIIKYKSYPSKWFE